jgi:hypothetical protein
VAILGLCIGANTAVFSIKRAVSTAGRPSVSGVREKTGL